MKPSIGFLKVVARLLVCAALLAIVSCKPEDPRVLDQETGALVSPVATRIPTLISPLPTPSPWPATPEPTVTTTPQPDPLIVYDPVNRFSLRLLSGWRAAVGGTTVIVNYDDTNLGSEGNFPPGAMKIQIGIGRLVQNQSFDQWLSNWLAISVAPLPDSGLSPITATVPQSATVGHYEGVTYFLNAQPRIKEIVLPLNDGRVFIAGLTPGDSPALSEALSILSTLSVSSDAPSQP